MPTIQEVVSDHRKHYLDRKLARSPLLHFSPGAHRIDLHELFRGVQPNLPVVDQNANGVSDPQSLVRTLLEGRFQGTIHGVRSAIIKKLERMQKAAGDSMHSTGQHTLFLGYPCIVLPAAGGKSKLAPLTLFAVQIVISSQRITIRRVLDSNEQGAPVASEALLNRLVGAYVKREYDVDLNGHEHRFDIAGAELEAQIQHVLAPWKGIKREFCYPQTSEVITKEELKRLEPTSNDPYIADHAILGLAEFSGQALIDDLDQIEKAFGEGQQCPAALAKLVMSASDHVDNEAVEPGAESRKWLVEKSDPSQECVVWSQKANSLVVLQGPPGTGKSQTIVNIVADALAQKKTVMVVCQKRSAIEVVHKRLAAVGLGELAVLVDDIDKDRLKVVRRIDGIEMEFHSNLLNERERTTIARSILADEARVDAVIEAINDRTDGTVPSRLRFGDIKALLKGLRFLNPSTNWSPQLKQSVVKMMGEGFTLEDLKRSILGFHKIDAEARKLRYGQSSWTGVNVKLEDNQVLLEEVLSHCETAHDLGRELSSGGTPLHHDSQTSWVAEHPWLHQVGSGFPVSGFLSSTHQRHEFRRFQVWIEAIRKIASVNPVVDADVLAAALRSGTLDIAFLTTLANDARELHPLLALKSDIAKHPVLRMADEHLPGERGNWATHIHAMALHTWLRELLMRQQEGFRDAPRISVMVAQLGAALKDKRELDALDILNGYQGRVDARNTLKNRNLLRLRAGQGRPKTSLRKLYSDGMHLLNNVVPLLLVSPETASSMLPLKAGLFDVVVIDEASQMFVAEALPMLFRAKHAVIAGDRQQMPPADFFAYSDAEDEDGNEEEIDGELDPLVAASGVYRLLEASDNALPAASQSRLSLLVHYRSERKELIDFSNHAFYDGKLIIPAGNAALPPFMQTAIEFENVDGQFVRGVNEMECRRIVEILRNIWQVRESLRPTVGVIVANAKQRDRVLEVLQEECSRDAKFRAAYEQEDDRSSDGEDVSFFVRSVEHVQGDERDLIIFGLTYSGSSRAYGPLNAKNDGRKRLNVAITRAKRGMIVLTSLTVSHVSNAAEKGSQERYYVWQYLNYARAVAANDHEGVDRILNQLNDQRHEAKVAASATESPFEEDVKRFVESLGLHVNCQVGESGFRIDLGVRVSKDSRNYLCGLECDGARYHSGWRARTSDVWRQEILEAKGWKILRIWSTDWFENSEEAKNKLAKELLALSDAAQSKATPTQHQFIRRASIDQAAVEPILASSVSPVNLAKTPEASGATKASAQGTVQTETKTIVQTGVDTQICVEVGDTVEYEYVDDCRLASAHIVRGTGDPTSGTINRDSALARALLDTVTGEEIEFLSPKGKIKLIVRTIRRLAP
jgi:very-short-patch-repair endonuclease